MALGCMKLGPDYHRPDIGIKTPSSYQHTRNKTITAELEDHWWEVFGDSKLNQLAHEALQNNLDLKKATSKILEVRAQFLQIRAERFPSLSLNAQGKRQRQVKTTSIAGMSSDRETTTYNLSLPASFELDLWGHLARGEESARAILLEAQENRHTVAQTIVAEVISLYFKMESLERRIQLNSKTVKNHENNLELIKKRYKRGLTNILDLLQARRSLAQAKSTLPSLRQELGITQQNMAVLLGHYPRTKPPRQQPEDYFKHLNPVPAGLPSDLLLRRPDIRAAEARLKALNAQVGIATASRFPSITLTGSLGYSSKELDQLLTPDSQLWNIALGIIQPLFDAGRLKAGQKAAEARYQQGMIEYAKKVLTAFSEVEKALLTREEQHRRRELLLNFLAQARISYKVAKQRYLSGIVGFLTVLVAERSLFQAEENLVLADLAILTNRVTLHRALGGGWAQLKDKQGQQTEPTKPI